jgi:hypothetical protein
MHAERQVGSQHLSNRHLSRLRHDFLDFILTSRRPIRSRTPDSHYTGSGDAKLAGRFQQVFSLKLNAFHNLILAKNLGQKGGDTRKKNMNPSWRWSEKGRLAKSRKLPDLPPALPGTVAP